MCILNYILNLNFFKYSIFRYYNYIIITYKNTQLLRFEEDRISYFDIPKIPSQSIEQRDGILFLTYEFIFLTYDRIFDTPSI